MNRRVSQSALRGLKSETKCVEMKCRCWALLGSAAVYIWLESGLADQ